MANLIFGVCLIIVFNIIIIIIYIYIYIYVIHIYIHHVSTLRAKGRVKVVGFADNAALVVVGPSLKHLVSSCSRQLTRSSHGAIKSSCTLPPAKQSQSYSLGNESSSMSAYLNQRRASVHQVHGITISQEST